MRSSLAIADQFVLEAKNNDAPPLTPMQLLKLVYIAHGFSLGAFDAPLISDAVEAWKYGPVIPRLYKEISKYGKNGVTRNIQKTCLVPLEKPYIDLIKWVYNKYKNFDGIQLSELTHRAGSPWDQVYNSDLYFESKTIKNSLINQYYKQFMK